MKRAKLDEKDLGSGQKVTTEVYDLGITDVISVTKSENPLSNVRGLPGYTCLEVGD
jgi:hypothetical protein